MRNDEKVRLTTEELSGNLTTSYYEKRIEILQERIANIRLGEGDTANGNVYKSADSLKSPVDKERRINELKKKIEKHKETIKEIEEAISAVNKAIPVFDQLVRKNILISAFSDSLRGCLLKYETVKGERVRVPSETYDQIFKNKYFEKAKSKYRRLWAKEKRKIDREKNKISRDTYLKLKQNRKRNIVEDEESREYEPNYYSLEFALKDNNYTLDSYANELYGDIRKRYVNTDGGDYLYKLDELGVDISKLKEAEAISNGKELDFDEYGDILKDLNHLSSEYSIHNRFKTYYILVEDLGRVYKLAREVECLDLILDAFEDTILSDFEMFSEIKDIYRKQNKKLYELSKKTMEMYQRSGMKTYVEAERKLRELYKNAGILYNQLEEARKKFGLNDPETKRIRDLLDSTKSELLGIVIKYPELNRPEYNIDLSIYDKKGRYVGEDVQYNDYEYHTPEMSSSSAVEEEKQNVPLRVVTDEELADLNRDSASDNSDEVVMENNNELPYELKGIRTAYYSRYMVEKVKGSDLGSKSFSEYLEVVAPELKALISYEKARETKAANVFKLYVKYLTFMPDKNQAMSFSEFARLRYGLEDSDLPFEYSDEEIRKKLV